MISLTGNDHSCLSLDREHFEAVLNVYGWMHYLDWLHHEGSGVGIADCSFERHEIVERNNFKAS